MRTLLTIYVDDKGIIHMQCSLKNRADALELIKQLGVATAKVSDDLIKDVVRKGG